MRRLTRLLFLVDPRKYVNYHKKTRGNYFHRRRYRNRCEGDPKKSGSNRDLGPSGKENIPRRNL